MMKRKGYIESSSVEIVDTKMQNMEMSETLKSQQIMEIKSEMLFCVLRILIFLGIGISQWEEKFWRRNKSLLIQSR